MKFRELIDLLFLIQSLCKGSRGSDTEVRVQLSSEGHSLYVSEDGEMRGLWMACVGAPEEIFDDGVKGRRVLFFGSSLESSADACIDLIKTLCAEDAEAAAF